MGALIGSTPELLQDFLERGAVLAVHREHRRRPAPQEAQGLSCPVGYDRHTGMWAVEDPELVRAVLRDPATFGPENALTAHTPLGARALRTLSAAGFALPPTLANNATPSHRGIRQAVAQFFSPARVAAVQPLTRDLVQRRLSRVGRALDGDAPVDLVHMVAAEVPALVLLHLLGVADVDIATLKRWSQDSLELFWGRPDAAEQERLATTVADFYRWLRERATAARSSPADDLFGRLVALGLPDREICAVAYFLLVAGQETTCQLISTAFHRLIADPVHWRAIAAEPGLAAPAVEQVLSQASSVPTWRRVTTRQTVLGPARIPAGAPVLLRLTGTGGPADLAFGVGLHRCLGAGLARMETRTVVQEVSAALPMLRLTEPEPPMIDLLSFRAPRRVLVRRGEASTDGGWTPLQQNGLTPIQQNGFTPRQQKRFGR